jgi:hypothetical protein
LTKARIISLLLIASLLAYFLAYLPSEGFGMSSGGGLL